MIESILNPYKEINVNKLPYLKMNNHVFIDNRFLVVRIDFMQYLINKKLHKNYAIPFSMYDLPNQICELYCFMQEKLYRVEYDQHFVNTLKLFLFLENIHLKYSDDQYILKINKKEFVIENCYELISLMVKDIEKLLYEEYFHQTISEVSYQLVERLSRFHTLEEVYQAALKDEILRMSIDMPLLHLYLHYETISVLKERYLLIQLYNQISKFSS